MPWTTEVKEKNRITKKGLCWNLIWESTLRHKPLMRHFIDFDFVKQLCIWLFISEWEFISLCWMSISWQTNCAQATMSFNEVLSRSLPTELKAFLHCLKYVSFPMEDGFVENCFLFSWLLHSVLQYFREVDEKWNIMNVILLYILKAI